MKKILLLSIVLNLGLALAVGYGLKKGTSPTAPAAEEQPSAFKSEEKPKAASKKVAATKEKSASVVPAKPAFSWREVESPDYKIYIANLRALHCPESTIADIIIADVNKYYRNKIAPFRKDTDSVYKYWTDYSYNRRDPAFEKLQRETELEKKNLLKELLGKSYREEMALLSDWQMESTDPFMQGSSKDKKDRLAEISDKFNDMKYEIYQKSRGMQDEDDRQALRKIEQDRTAELAKIFSPDELFEYQLRTSDTVRNAKWNELQGFNATEDEFRAIMKAKLLAENGRDEKVNSDDRARQSKEANDDLKATLGDDRYKEYTMNQNYDYRNLKNIVEKYGGDKQIAQQLFGLKDDLQKAVDQVRSDRTLSTEQRDAKLVAIQTEVEKTLTEALTERGYKTFKRNAYWLQNIAPRKASRAVEVLNAP